MQPDLPFPHLFALFRKQTVGVFRTRCYSLALSVLFLILFSMPSFEDPKAWTLFIISITVTGVFAVRAIAALIMIRRFGVDWRNYAKKIVQDDEWRMFYEDADHDVDLGYTRYQRVVICSHYLIDSKDLAGVYHISKVESLFHDRLQQHEFSLDRYSKQLFKLTCRMTGGEHLLLSREDSEMRAIVNDLLEANPSIRLDAEAAVLVDRIPS
jgi:hypothetical protein